MNTSVEKLVNRLFEDLEMNDELYAIRDQLTNECQRMFGVMAVQGIVGGKAILRIKEHLDQRKDELLCFSSTVKTEKNPNEQTYLADSVQYLDVDILVENLNVACSDDSRIHIIYDRKKYHQIYAGVEGSVLLVRSEGEKSLPGPGRSVRQDLLDDELASDIENYSDAKPQITVLIPEELVLSGKLRSTSGDICLSGIQLKNTSIKTDSGNIHLQLKQSDLSTLLCETNSGAIQK